MSRRLPPVASLGTFLLLLPLTSCLGVLGDLESTDASDVLTAIERARFNGCDVNDPDWPDELCATDAGDTGWPDPRDSGIEVPPPPPTCPDGVCDQDESCDSCPADCGSCPPAPPACPDGACNGGETCSSCPADCGSCPDVSCEDLEGGNCNTDPGFGDHCAASDNTAGCSADRFWAWCNRRNKAYPDIWDNWIYTWLQDRCDTVLVLMNPGSSYPTFGCTNSSSGTTYLCTTPLVLAFDPAAPVVCAPSAHSFAIAPDVGPVRSDWPTEATPWLAIDRDGSGAIEDAAELFGSAARLADGGRASNGFEALAELDANGDGWIDRRDPGWEKLLSWRDLDRDRISTPDELSPVGDTGLLAISLSYDLALRCDARGNCERERAVFFWRDAEGRTRSGAVIDIHLKLELE